GYGCRLSPVRHVVASNTREAGDVGRSGWTRRAALLVVCIAEIAAQVRLELSRSGAGVTAAHQAIEVLGMERALHLLPRVLRIAWDVIEVIEAADAAARRADLAAAGAPADLRAGLEHAIRRHPAAGDPAADRR